MRKLGFLILSGTALAAAPALAQGNPSRRFDHQLAPPGARDDRRHPRHPADRAIPGRGGASGSHAAVPRAGTPAASPATRMPNPSAPAASPSEAAAPSVNLTVQFATNSAELTPAATHTLDELGRALSSQALASYKFRIEGHTDTVGNPDHNQQLSEQRANTVVDYLVSKFGLDRSRLEAMGMGETHPLVPTGKNVAEPRNRRVTVVNVGA